jgi:ATP-dependent exoDNAse (exonuclease V) alpha subunit
VITPSNEERLELNRVIRAELQASGAVEQRQQELKVLVPRNELTGAERSWAARYDPGDVVRYSSGSRRLGIKAGEYARGASVDREHNLLTVLREAGEVLTYSPARLQGVSVFKEAERQFAIGDRLQLTAPFNARRIANRELGSVQKIDSTGKLELRLDNGEHVCFNLREHRSLDHGYAVTSHSSQGRQQGGR